MAHETYNLTIEFVGIKTTLTAELTRILSPITTERLTKKLPVTAAGRYFFGGKDFFLIPVGIKKGMEKPTNEVEKGDLTYDPGSDSLMICLKNMKTPMKVNKLGKITSGLQNFDKIERSATARVSLAK